MSHTLPPMSGLSGATSAAPALPLRPRRGRLHAVVATVRPGNGPRICSLSPPPVPPVRLVTTMCRFALGSRSSPSASSPPGSTRSTTSATRKRTGYIRKRARPVAAGELAPAAALRLGVALMVAGLALCLAIRPLLGLVGAGYLALTLSYAVLLRRIVILDIVAIAGGPCSAPSPAASPPPSPFRAGSSSSSPAPRCSSRPRAMPSWRGPMRRVSLSDGCSTSTRRRACV